MTTFGTPNTPQATKVMLLGSGELGKEVLIALQRLGVETIAVDRYENAPGHGVVPGLLHIGRAVDLALAFARAAHHGFDDAGVADARVNRGLQLGQ